MINVAMSEYINFCLADVNIGRSVFPESPPESAARELSLLE